MSCGAYFLIEKSNNKSYNNKVIMIRVMYIGSPDCRKNHDYENKTDETSVLRKVNI